MALADGYVMIAWAAGFEIGECRLSRSLGGFEVVAMLDVGLYIIPCVEFHCMIPLCGGELLLLLPSVAVGSFNSRGNVPDGMEVTR
jgi:hypothetical protein